MKRKSFIENLLTKADITLGGNNPGDMIVYNEKLYDRVMKHGTLGLGEAYAEGWWDAEPLDVFFTKVLSANLEEEIKTPGMLIRTAPVYLGMLLQDLGHVKRSHHVGEHHYDIGNDLYEKMLDKRLVYTCGYFQGGAKTLDEAQEAKLDLICKKIGLEPGMTVLDIGCGWGSFLKYAAEKYGVSGVGITVSEEQAKLAREQCAGLPIEIRVVDYRHMEGEFDRIVSIGMFEHVGVKYYETYMKKAKELLKPDGLFLLHTIGGHASDLTTDPWIDRYIFPGGVIPSMEQVSSALQPHFVMEDWHNFGPDYATTLRAWFANFDAAWGELKENPAYDDYFYRMWKYYLLSCAGAFDARHLQLWQIVLSPKGVEGGYVSVR
jgi:cyclopropane-fatty-acyl-phospholipid synthase